MRRSASIRNNCGTGPKTKVPNYGSTKHPNYGCSAVKLRAENPVAGNGIFGCGDTAPKIATKKRQRGQRPKSGKGAAGNPRRKALFGVVSETGGLRRLDGGGCRAQTGDPPPSRRTRLRTEPGTEICDAETGTQKRAYRLAEIDPETRWECEKPPFRRNKCEKSDGSLSPSITVVFLL